MFQQDSPRLCANRTGRDPSHTMLPCVSHAVVCADVCVRHPICFATPLHLASSDLTHTTCLYHDSVAKMIQFTNGTRIPIKGTFVNEGTFPPNSTWAMNPIPPRCLGPGCTSRPPFCEPCPLPVVGPDGPRDCSSCDNTPGGLCLFVFCVGPHQQMANITGQTTLQDLKKLSKMRQNACGCVKF